MNGMKWRELIGEIRRAAIKDRASPTAPRTFKVRSAWTSTSRGESDRVTSPAEEQQLAVSHLPHRVYHGIDMVYTKGGFDEVASTRATATIL